MGRFLGRVLAVIVGLVIFSFISFFIVVGILAALGSGKKPVNIDDVTILKLDLNKPIYEKSYSNPFEGLPIGSKMADGYGLVELREALQNAASNPKIKAIYLKMGLAQTSYASLQELRGDLENFKKSDKKIYAFSEYYTEGAYYLSSVADKIYMPGPGYIEFNGLAYNVTFFKGTLDKLEIKPEIFKAGNYKSAVEPFFLDKMSEPNKEQSTSFINAMYDVILLGVSKSRKIDFDKLKNISDSMLVHNPTDAKRLGLIDDCLYKDQVEDAIKKDLNMKKLNVLAIDKYMDSFDEKDTKSGDKVAVIIASGEIVMGKGKDDEIGATTVIENIRKARDDKDVKAIVLRINSPGGSSLASDLIWREIMVAKAKMPVVASMSDLAASGGYYMSMPCDHIFAQENTITGSIGVFGMWFNVKNFFNNKLGITTDGVKTGKYSDLALPTKVLTDAERKFIQAEVDSTYRDFVSKAAAGRKRAYNDIEKVASGRVWTGKQALQIGLVDKIGGLTDAVAYAAQLAKMKDYSIDYIPENQGFVESLMGSFSSDNESDVEEKMKKELGELYPYFVYLQKIKKREGMQARMLDITIE
jgi:protease IV